MLIYKFSYKGWFELCNEHSTNFPPIYSLNGYHNEIKAEWNSQLVLDLCTFSIHVSFKAEGNNISFWMKFPAWMNLCTTWSFKIYFFLQDSLSFPLTSPDWSAGEEKLLLEVCGLSMGNFFIFFLLTCYMLNVVCFFTLFLFIKIVYHNKLVLF